MNKTVSINISGFVFNIEEQAYEDLRLYLESIRKKFHSDTEREEIMEDIEARIAEIFQTKINNSKEVIVSADVADLLGIMGKPEDFVDEENEDPKSDESTHERSESTYGDVHQKRLFRDPDNSTIGGVCAGIGHYFSLDITLVRVIFVLLVILGGSGFLLYIILLLVVPEAKSTADKLQMKGRPVNLGNIKDHVNEFKDSTKEGAQHAKHTFTKAVKKGVEASNGFIKAFSKLIGIGLTLGGIFALIALLIIFFGNSGLLPIVGTDSIEDLPTFIEIIYPGNAQHTLIFISIMVVTLLPVISILIAGIKLLFDIQKTIKPLAITGLIIWLCGVGVLALTGIELGMNFRNVNDIEYRLPVNSAQSDVLFVDVTSDDVFSDHIEYHEVWNQSELIKVDKDKIFMGFPSLHIIQKEDSSGFEVNIIKRSSGLSQKQAINNAERTDFDISFKNNRLKLAPYYSINRTDKLRGQEVTVEVKVPLGAKVNFGDNIDRINVWIEGERYHDHQGTYSNSQWVSEYDGLRCSSCNKKSDLFENSHLVITEDTVKVVPNEPDTTEGFQE